MKTTCLFFLTLTWAALRQGIGFAVPASPASQPTSTESSAHAASGHPGDAGHAAPADDGKHPVGRKASEPYRGRGRASDTHHAPSPASLTKANHPQQLANNRQRSLPGNALHHQLPGSNKSKGAGGGGLVPNEIVHNALSARMSNVVRPGVPPLNNVHHRSPNPAVVTGSLNSDRRNNGAIDGTRMSRRL